MIGGVKEVTEFTFLNRKVGRACLCSMLGIGVNRLRKAATMMPDMRLGKDKTGSQRDTYSVDAFLSIMYEGVAEVLPDRQMLMKTIISFAAVLPSNLNQVIYFTFDNGDPVRFVRRGRAAASDDPEWDLESDCQDQEDLRDFLDKPGTGAIWASFQPEEKKLTKFLPPGTVHDLYTHNTSTRSLFGAVAVSCLSCTYEL